MWPNRFSALTDIYPYHERYAYDRLGRAILSVSIGSTSFECLVDTGATITVLPYQRFPEYWGRVEEARKADTAKKGSPLKIYPLKPHLDGKILVSLGSLKFMRPMPFFLSDETDEGILGLSPSLLKNYAFVFEKDFFHLFARE